MDGATLCSWVFVCECAHVHFYMKNQRFVALYEQDIERSDVQPN